MTKAQLEAVHDALVEIIDSWNQAAADEDRGPSNDAICLTLYDDGSGTIGRRTFGIEGVEEFHGFDNFDSFVSILEKGEGVEFEEGK